MQLKLKASPYLKSSASTACIMRDLLIGLLVLVITSLVNQYLLHGITYSMKALTMYMTAIIVALAVESVWAKIHKRSIKSMLETSFPFITPLLLTLTLPIGTPLYVVAVGSFFATFFGKLVYGGFGQNIFNPALVGRVVVHLSFASKLTTTLSGVDTIASATPLTMLKQTKLPTYTFSQLFFGMHEGALGETCIVMLIIVGVILAIRHVYDVRITLSYLAMASLLSLFYGLFNNAITSPFSFMVKSIMSGGLFLGAIFMATDPVTSPLSPLGKLIFGLSLAFLTMLIRFQANYPEGVMFSILIMNMLTPFIDHSITGQTSTKIKKQVLILFGFVMIYSLVIIGVALMK